MQPSHLEEGIDVFLHDNQGGMVSTRSLAAPDSLIPIRTAGSNIWQVLVEQGRLLTGVSPTHLLTRPPHETICKAAEMLIGQLVQSRDGEWGKHATLST